MGFLLPPLSIFGHSSQENLFNLLVDSVWVILFPSALFLLPLILLLFVPEIGPCISYGYGGMGMN